MGLDGAGASTTRSQPLHANFGRTWRMTLKLSGTYSSCSATSSPNWRRVPPQPGQQSPKCFKFGSLVRYGEEELTRWEQAQPTGGEDAAERIKPKSVRSNGLLRKSG